MKTNNPFYKTARWVSKRERILRRDEYECRECKRFGKVTEATTVHHCFPLEHYEEFKFHSENLISLCGKCHNSMHDRVTNELTNKGKEWMERVRNKLYNPPT